MKCPATCGRCADVPVESTATTGADSGESNCVMWRQTADCSPNGKRQSHADQPCHLSIKGDWSGYCECSGGVRAGESACNHPSFTCAEKCREQYSWLREQRAKRQPEKVSQHATLTERRCGWEWRADVALQRLSPP